MDPDAQDPDGTPLQIRGARLDVDIHYDNLPVGFGAQDIIQSITVTPFQNLPTLNGKPNPGYDPNQPFYAFQPGNFTDEPLPAYNFDVGTSSVTMQTANVVFSGPDVFLHDIFVIVDPDHPPQPGDANLALTDVQYFNQDSFGGVPYGDIIGKFTTTVSDGSDGFPPSEIDAEDSFGNDTAYTGTSDPNNPDGGIIPASSAQTLAGVDVPEPLMVGPAGALALISMRKRRGAVA